jgi:hypothetical protein
MPGKGLYRVHIPIDATIEVEAGSELEAIELSRAMPVLDVYLTLAYVEMEVEVERERYAECIEWEERAV